MGQLNPPQGIVVNLRSAVSPDVRLAQPGARCHASGMAPRLTVHCSYPGTSLLPTCVTFGLSLEYGIQTASEDERGAASVAPLFSGLVGRPNPALCLPHGVAVDLDGVVGLDGVAARERHGHRYTRSGA